MKKRFLVTIMFLLFGIILPPTNILAEVGVTDATIKIGATIDLTGPSAFAEVEYNKGINLYFRQVNEEGGIHGRKIDFIVEDDGYVVSKAVGNTKKLIERDKVFCLIATSSTESTLAQLPLLQKHKVPLVASHSMDEVWIVKPQKYIFPVNVTTNMAQGRHIVWFIVNDLSEKTPKIGIIKKEIFAKMECWPPVNMPRN